MFNKILCLIGYHKFAWKLRQDENGITEILYLNKIPDHARCIRCNKLNK